MVSQLPEPDRGSSKRLHNAIWRTAQEDSAL